MVFIDGEMVRVVTAVATASPQESAKTLEQMKLKLESNIKQLKQQGSIEEIEKSLVRLEKLNADIMLVNLKNKGL
jgi:mevalonate kinase